MSSDDRSRDETMDRGALRAIQEQKLGRLMAELPRNPFYRRKLADAGVEASTVTRHEDLARLPFTRKAELLEAQRRRPPYGDLLTYPLSRYRYLHQTSGTSGKPLLWLDTEDDWQTWLRCWGRVFRGAGVGQEDVVFCAFSFGPYVAHWSSLAGARAIGAMALPGAGMSSRERLEKIFEHSATVLASTPTYALHLAEVAAELGLDLASSPVRVTIHAGEPGASVPNVKRRIEEVWGARAFDHAGATEVGAWSFDCQADDHAIHLDELEFLFEVVDPASGEAVAAGARGELVITTLARWGMPVVRYRTGDLVVRVDEPCACGRTLSRLEGGLLGRADDMLIVRGVNVYPSAIDDLMRGLAEVVEYQVEIRRRQALDELLIKVETAPEVPFEPVEEALHEAFRSRLDIRVAVARAEAGSLPRYELKARRYRRVGDD
jgi:phenylacetate-CoA ligase